MPSKPFSSTARDRSRIAPDDGAVGDQEADTDDFSLDGREPVRGFDLSTACSVLKRVLGRRGSERWTAVEFGPERDREIACLEEWAGAEGGWLKPEGKLLWDSSEKFGEHHLRFRGTRVFKATKRHEKSQILRFGVYPIISGRALQNPAEQISLGSGTPSQYLARLELLNHWCSLPEAGSVLTRLEGGIRVNGEFSIITSQPYFKPDRQLQETEIANWLSGLGFRCVTAGIWYGSAQNLALFDVKPSNVILSQGRFIPVDLIPIQPSGAMKHVLNAAIA
jgi:hypothetical protein